VRRREFLKTSAGLLATAAVSPRLGWGAPPARRPNIVLIVADDLGYADIGVYGCTDVPTPNVDSLAKNGVRFTNGYVSCPVCSPTRAGLMTGRYQQRFGHEFNPGPPTVADDIFGLSLKEVTLAERLKKAGYATGIFGKWHLGYLPQYHPMKRGFDEFFGFLAGAHPYVQTEAPSNLILRGSEPVKEEPFYTTDAFTREAVSFIERRQKESFFLYLPYNAVHGPLQASEKYLSRFSSIGDDKRRTFAAMLSAMDDGVGRVLETLRKANLEDNTLIFFVSDNGGPTPGNTSRNDPLRGYKAQVLEGGIRVPFMVQWKGRLPGGKVYDQPVIALDVHPTVAAAVGASVADSKLDGVDLVPYLSGTKKGVPHDRLFWRFGEQSAIRMGDWKLAKLADGAPQLYNLAKDIGEANNLAASEPAKLKELQAAYDEWNAQLMEPRWGRGGAAGQDAKAKAARKAAKAGARKQPG